MAPAAAQTAEGLENPYDMATIAPFWRRKNGILLYFLLTSSLFATMSLGIDGVCPPWLRFSWASVLRTDR